MTVIQPHFAESQLSVSAFGNGMSVGFDSGEYRLNLAALVRVKARGQDALSEPVAGKQRTLLGVGGFPVVLSSTDLFLVCKRSDHGFWQCPQGGLEHDDPDPIHGVRRELNEELGIDTKHIQVVYESKIWRRYEFGAKSPKDKGRKGQQQKWFVCDIPSLDLCSLENSHGEFSELKTMVIESAVSVYAGWKARPFVDFCFELGLLVPRPRSSHAS